MLRFLFFIALIYLVAQGLRLIRGIRVIKHEDGTTTTKSRKSDDDIVDADYKDINE